MVNFRVGQGYDVHRLVEGRPLILGGMRIEHSLGLDGHSDADVLVHAIIDALLGAVALGDIGRHFPDTDPAYKDIDSMFLLVKTSNLIEKHGWKIGNIDSTLIAQRPKLAPYIDDIRKNLATTLNLELSQISVKAKTNEHLGFEGKELGIVAQACTLIYKESTID